MTSPTPPFLPANHEQTTALRQIGLALAQIAEELSAIREELHELNERPSYHPLTGGQIAGSRE